MFEIFGVVVTRGQLLLFGIALALLGISWLVLLLLEGVTKWMRETDAEQLAAQFNSGTKIAKQAAQKQSAASRTALSALLARLAPHFSFKGRANREQYIVTQILAGIFLGVVLVIGDRMYDSWNDTVQVLGALLVVLAIGLTCWLLWAVSTRRTRDTGVTVWWVLALLVPPLNLAGLVFLLVVPSEEFAGRGL